MSIKFKYLAGLLLIILIIFLIGYFRPYPLELKKSSFSTLPGFDQGNFNKSLEAFKLSCQKFLQMKPKTSVGSAYLPLVAQDWHEACLASFKVAVNDNKAAQLFFKQHFTPVYFYQKIPIEGLFTGYYQITLAASLYPNQVYSVPLYGVPSDLIYVNLNQFKVNYPSRPRIVGRLEKNYLQPYYDRKQIVEGMIATKAPVLAWVNNPVDRLFLEIQGSGVLELESGDKRYISYESENGRPYTAVGQVLIDKKVMTKDNASMQRIKRYLLGHPKQMNTILNQNQSFVFFKLVNQKAAQGAQSTDLTPGYSLAVDRKWIPLGMPIWLDTQQPSYPKASHLQTFQRLMIAQDTGGAIRGKVRGDIYWGHGKKATYIAGHMKNKGYYWLLIPNAALAKVQQRFADTIHDFD